MKNISQQQELLDWLEGKSMSDKNQGCSLQIGSGISFFPLMFLIFMTLKLCGVISWSWWWVTAPLWGPPALFMSIVLIILALALLVAIVYGCLYLLYMLVLWIVGKIKNEK